MSERSDTLARCLQCVWAQARACCCADHCSMMTAGCAPFSNAFLIALLMKMMSAILTVRSSSLLPLVPMVTEGLMHAGGTRN